MVVEAVDDRGESVMSEAKMTVNPNIADPVEAAYWAGVEAGMRRYAWWKDGREYVGTCGNTLTTAIRDMDRDSGAACWHPRFLNEDGVDYCGRCGIYVAPCDRGGPAPAVPYD
jgi:hypothetical protein